MEMERVDPKCESWAVLQLFGFRRDAGWVKAVYMGHIVMFSVTREARDMVEVEPWRSRLHHDGSAFDGWFIIGIGKEKGEQITYHLPERMWSDCDWAETLDRAPEWDGHTSADVLERLRAQW